MNDYNVAIIVPTMNRPSFIIRMLSFYKKNNSIHSVYIGDSSSKENFEIINQYLVANEFNFKVYHYKCGTMNEAEAILHCAVNVKEDYCTFSGDDDFHIPKPLSKCAQFLSKNPSYSTCHGKGLTFETGTDATGTIYGMSEYRMLQIEEECLVKRIDLFTRDYYVPLFSVHRRIEFIESYKQAVKISSVALREVLPNILAIMDGKAKKLSFVSILRNTHSKRIIISPTLFAKELVLDNPILQQVINIIESCLLAKDNQLNTSQASIHAKHFMNNYIKNFHFKNKNIAEYSKLRMRITYYVKKVFPKIWIIKLSCEERKIYKILNEVIEA
jgi:glycosyltransferase domain-containing protein